MPDGTDKPGVFYLDESGRPALPGQDNYDVAEKMAREVLGRLDPERQAKRCGARVAKTGKTYTLVEFEFFGDPVQVKFPTGEVFDPSGRRELPVWERILLLHFVGRDSPPHAHSELIGFQQVPSGGFYFEAFERRAHGPLARLFGDHPERLIEAGRAMGARAEDLGDAAVRVSVLPKVPVIAVIHAADEEFPAEAKILFQSDITTFFCTEDIAVLGGLTAGKLIQAARRLNHG